MEENLGFWVKLIGSFITLIGLYLTYVVSRSKAHADKENNFRDDILAELSNIRAENSALREKIELLSKENNELNTKIKILEHEWQIKVQLFESAHNDLPLPMWLKDKDGKMLSLNPMYEQIFLIPRGFSREDYVNNYDSDVWPSDVAEAFGRHDKHVYETGKTWVGIEEVPDKEDRLINWRIIKYIRYAQGVRLGIAGIAIPIQEEGYNGVDSSSPFSR